MKVSIICPIYNGEKYLEKLVEKIREQEKIEEISFISNKRVIKKL